MCRNKFSIGGLMGVHVSSIVNGVIRTVSNQFIYLFIYLFFAKKFHVYKNANQTKTNLENKIKRTKNSKSLNFSRIKTSNRGKPKPIIGWFWFDLHFCSRETFSQKNKLVWNCPNNLICYSTAGQCCIKLLSFC